MRRDDASDDFVERCRSTSAVQGQISDRLFQTFSSPSCSVATACRPVLPPSSRQRPRSACTITENEQMQSSAWGTATGSHAIPGRSGPNKRAELSKSNPTLLKAWLQHGTHNARSCAGSHACNGGEARIRSYSGLFGARSRRRVVEGTGESRRSCGRMHGQMERWEQSLCMLQELRRGWSTPVVNVSVYNASASMCETDGKWAEALEIFHAMRQSGPEPDSITYGTTISACEKGQQWAHALELLEEILHDESGFGKVTVRACRAGIGACVAGQQWEHALRLFDLMQRRSVVADALTYEHAMSACAQSKQWNRALGLLDQMWCSGHSPSAHAYNAALVTCVQAGLWQHALDVFDTMRSYHLSLDFLSTGVFEQAIRACEQGHLWEHALMLLSRARQSVPALESIYDGAVESCLKSQHFQCAEMLSCERQSRGRTSAQQAVWDATIAACESSQQSQQVLHLFEEMQSSDCPPGQYAYNAAVKASSLTKSWEQALSTLQDMRDATFMPDADALNETIAACTRSQQWAHANRLVIEMRNEALQKRGATCGARGAERAPQSQDSSGRPCLSRQARQPLAYISNAAGNSHAENSDCSDSTQALPLRIPGAASANERSLKEKTSSPSAADVSELSSPSRKAGVSAQHPTRSRGVNLRTAAPEEADHSKTFLTNR